MRRIQSVAAGGGVFQAALEILAHVLNQRLVLIDEAGDLLEEGIKGDILGKELEIGEAPLRRGGSGHSGTSESIIMLSEVIDNRKVTPYADSHEPKTTIAPSPHRPTQASCPPLGRSPPGQTVAAIQCLRQGGLPLQGRSPAKAWTVLPAELHPER